MLTVIRIVTTLGPSRLVLPVTMASADSRSLRFFISHSAFASLTGPPGVRHNSFAAQPPDLLLRFYVYLSGFGFICNLTHRLALYPVSVRRLLGFATPLPPPLTSPSTACGSLHLAVNTRGGTFTRKNHAMPGTPIKKPSNLTGYTDPVRSDGYPLRMQHSGSSASLPQDANWAQLIRSVW